jgi:DNA-binding transcriptional regulator YiaG
MPDLTPDTIRDLRRRLGLTQAALAARIGCSSIAVSLWERGERTPTGLYAKAVRDLMATTDKEQGR